MLSDKWKKKTDVKLGSLPKSFAPWRALLVNPKKGTALKNYFEELKNMDTLGAKLAVAYLKKTKEIADQLVKSGVADSAENVNAVLTNGFYWLYGPINEYV
jgi:hypothetical protein